MACGLLSVFALCDYILITMQQGLGVKCVHNRWAYATYTLLPMHEIGQNQRKKGGWAYITSWAYITYSTVVAPGSAALWGLFVALEEQCSSAAQKDAR